MSSSLRWDSSTCETFGYTRACLGREPPGKPDAGNPHVRFDEGEGYGPPYSTV
jgi:hypothetical protein